MLLQFLAESVILSVTGGIAGIIVGVVFSEMISLIAGWPAPIWRPSQAAFCFLPQWGCSSATTQLESNLDPIEALRYE